jgi:glycogen operon protein
MTGFSTDKGSPLPLGATCTAEGVNFAVFSRHAASVSLVLFEPGGQAPLQDIPLDPGKHKTGDIWHVSVTGLSRQLRYAFRVTGPTGNGHRFNDKRFLLDPYARAL